LLDSLLQESFFFLKREEGIAPGEGIIERSLILLDSNHE